MDCQLFGILKFTALGSYEITGLFLSEKHPFWVKLHSSRHDIFWHSVRDCLNPKGYQAIEYNIRLSVSENHVSNLEFEGMDVRGWIIPAVGIAQPCSKQEETEGRIYNELSGLDIQWFYLFDYNSLCHYLGYNYGYSGHHRYRLLYIGSTAATKFTEYGNPAEFPAKL